MYDIFEAHFSRYCYMRMTIQKKRLCQKSILSYLRI